MKRSEKLSFNEDEKKVEKIIGAIRALRNLRAEMNVPPSKKAKVCIASAFGETFDKGKAYICRLAFASEVETGESFEAEGAVRVITDSATVYMPMRELVDFTAELERLQKDMQKAIVDKEFFEKKLNNKGFVDKAPAAVVEQQRVQLKKVLDKIDMINESIEQLKAMQ